MASVVKFPDTAGLALATVPVHVFAEDNNGEEYINVDSLEIFPNFFDTLEETGMSIP